MAHNNEEVTLLVVEDDDIDATAISRAFKKLHLTNTLVRARDGIEALEYLRGENSKQQVIKPYMLLVDLNMPRMDGIELLGELRKDPLLSDSVVFVLTTSAADKDKLAAYDQNIAGYIVKSQIQNDFWDVINLLDCFWRVVSLPK